MSNQFQAFFQGEGTDRITAFSDGVFAISITLLVLDLRLPEATRPLSDLALAQALWELAPRIYAYALSFVVVGQYWIGHHRLLRWIRRFDGGFLWWNLLYLLVIAFMPFPTSVLASHPDTTVSSAFYVGTLALAGVFGLGMWQHAVAHGLLVEAITPALVRYVRWRMIVAMAIYLLAIPVAMVSPTAASLSGLLVPVVMRPLTHLLGRRL